jgi:hypothetical protein
MATQIDHEKCYLLSPSKDRELFLQAGVYKNGHMVPKFFKKTGKNDYLNSVKILNETGADDVF